MRTEAAETSPLPGFKIVRRIGRGGMGEILEAVRTGPGGFRKPVALKQLRLDAGMNDTPVHRFFREARISAPLEHPNIVRVKDFLAVGHRHYMVMELLKGRDLLSLCRNLGDAPLPPAIALI